MKCRMQGHASNRAFRGLLCAAVAAIFLAGCGTEPNSQSASTAPPTQPATPSVAPYESEATPWRVEMATQQRQDGSPASLQVLVTDLSRSVELNDIALVGPGGQRVGASRAVERERIVSGETIVKPSIGVGVFGGSSGSVRSGTGISVPVFTKRQVRGPETTVREVIAHIPVGAAPGYRARPQDWRVEVLATDVAGGSIHRTYPAPAAQGITGGADGGATGASE